MIGWKRQRQTHGPEVVVRGESSCHLALPAIYGWYSKHGMKVPGLCEAFPELGWKRQRQTHGPEVVVRGESSCHLALPAIYGWYSKHGMKVPGLCEAFPEMFVKLEIL